MTPNTPNRKGPMRGRYVTELTAAAGTMTKEFFMPRFTSFFLNFTRIGGFHMQDSGHKQRNYYVREI